MEANEARLNITWSGNNSDLPDPVPYNSTQADIKRWATEAVRSGFAGMPADPNADFTDFVVDYFGPNDVRNYNLISLRSKTPFGC